MTGRARLGWAPALLSLAILGSCATGGAGARQAPPALRGLRLSSGCSSPAAWPEPQAAAEVCHELAQSLGAAGLLPVADAAQADVRVDMLVSFHGDQAWLRLLRPADSAAGHSAPVLDEARFDRSHCGTFATGGPTARCLAAQATEAICRSQRLSAWAADRQGATPGAPPTQGQRLSEGRLAVLELQSRLKGHDAEQLDLPYLGDVVRGAALRALPRAQVMTHENLEVLLQAQGRALDQCEGECEVETGRMVGADLIVSGQVLRLGAQFKVDLKLHETATARLLGQQVASGRTSDELERELRRTVAELLGPLR